MARRKLKLRVLSCLCQKYTGAREGDDVWCNRCGDWMTVGICVVGPDGVTLEDARGSTLPIDPPF